jgi:hypothetical protein
MCNTHMSHSRSRVLGEIKDLLKSLDRKLDKLLERQVSEDLGLGSRQKELLKQMAKLDSRQSVTRVAANDVSSERARPDTDVWRRIENEILVAAERAGVDRVGVDRGGVYGRSFVPGAFVSLPDHLRETMQAIAVFGEATARQVCEKTGRSRAAESDYLNQLVDRGFLKKGKRGREVVFQVFSLHTLCPMCGTRVPLNVRFCSRCGAPLYRHEQRT